MQNKQIYSLIGRVSPTQWTHIYTGNVVDCQYKRKEYKYEFLQCKVIYQFNLKKYIP